MHIYSTCTISIFHCFFFFFLCLLPFPKPELAPVTTTTLSCRTCFRLALWIIRSNSSRPTAPTANGATPTPAKRSIRLHTQIQTCHLSSRDILWSNAAYHCISLVYKVTNGYKVDMLDQMYQNKGKRMKL